MNNLDFLGCIKISGANSRDFLQGQLTCDVSAVNNTTSTLGSYCNVKGRLQVIFQLLQIHEDFFLILPNELIDLIVKELNKYAIFSRVSVTHSTDFKVYGLLTPRNAKMPSFITLPTTQNQVTSSKDDSIICTQLIPSPEYLRFLILVSTNSEPEFPNLPSPATTWQLEELRAMVPTITLDTYEKFLPHYLNLPQLGAINFTKGCYRGQEIIARMHYRGNLKRNLHYIELENDTQPPGTVVNQASINPNKTAYLTEY